MSFRSFCAVLLETQSNLGVLAMLMRTGHGPRRSGSESPVWSAFFDRTAERTGLFLGLMKSLAQVGAKFGLLQLKRNPPAPGKKVVGNWNQNQTTMRR